MRALMANLMISMIVLALCGVGFAAETPVADVPVTKIVLFSSGVGYFEHTGEVDGAAVARLMFKTDQINDVLKSMVINADKGSAASVNYASRDPLIRALKSFAIDLSGNPQLADLLGQLRGAEVEVMAPDKLTGKILNVEAKTEHVLAGGADTVVTKAYLNLVTDKGIKSLNMDTVSAFRLTNEDLAGELNKALDLLITAHDTDRKPVEIAFTGEGKRNVRIGYITETPVWKTSYRLEFREGDAKAGKGKESGFFQGWAIVENTSDVDWKNVQLSLVSGRPISFIQDLYTPLYLPRPVVVPDMYASLRPQQYDEGFAAKGAAKDMPEAMPAPMAAAAPSPSAGARSNMSKDQARALAMQEARGVYEGGGPRGDMSLGEGVQSVADAAKVGELFSFTIKDRVDIARRRSALLPIVNGPIAAEKVSIYNQGVLNQHPLNGVYLINDTGLKMLGGPVTVFDGGMYAGDARIDNVAPNDKRLISYAIDLNMTVDPSVSSSQNMVSAKIVRGVLWLTYKTVYSQKYVIHNKADVKRQLIVEYPFNAGRKLLEPAKFEEKTPTVYRFRVPVDKEATTEFLVKEEQTHAQSVGILDSEVDALLVYVKNGEVPQKVRDALTKAIEIKNTLVQLQRRLKDVSDQLAAITGGQDRLRRNIDTAGRDSELGRRYLTKLAAEEDQIEKMNGEIAELNKQIETTQKALAESLKDLNVE